eukprot:gene48411-35782_t
MCGGNGGLRRRQHGQIRNADSMLHTRAQRVRCAAVSSGAALCCAAVCVDAIMTNLGCALCPTCPLCG